MKIASIDELIGALKAHEIHLASKQIIKTSAGKALKAEEPRINVEGSAQSKGKSNILKAETESSSNEASDDSTDNEIALMSRKFKQMLKKKGQSNTLFKKEKRYLRRSQKHYSKDIIYFECKKPCHIKTDCPQTKKRWTSSKKKKKKNLLATQEDLNSENISESLDEETTNIYPIANEDQHLEEVIVETCDSNTSL